MIRKTNTTRSGRRSLAWALPIAVACFIFAAGLVSTGCRKGPDGGKTDNDHAVTPGGKVKPATQTGNSAARTAPATSQVIDEGVIPGASSAAGEKARMTQALLEGTKKKIARFKKDLGRLPESLGELIAPPKKEADAAKWHGPYFSSGKLPMDLWGHELQYRLEGEGYRLSSAGPDGKVGTKDDFVVKP